MATSAPAPPENEPLHPDRGEWLSKLARTGLPALLVILAWPAVRGWLEGWAQREEGAGLGRLLLFALVVLIPWLFRWRKERAAAGAQPLDPRRALEPS